MKVLVGLGNPGDKYCNTRHNLGFYAVDKFISSYTTKNHKTTSFSNLYLCDDLIICKPITYMNLSGDSLLEIKNQYSVSNSDFLVVYDDLYLPIGSFKYSFNRGSGGHNGIKNIIEKLNGSDFASLRIGIGPREKASSIADYVLDNFSPAELSSIDELMPSLMESIKCFVRGDSISSIQNKFNQ